MTSPSHPLFASVYDPMMRPAERTLLAEHRRYLADGLSGSVLDLGAGTGAMFPYFAEVTETGARLSFYAIEPDPHMHRRAVRRARDLGLDVRIVRAGAEALPFAADVFDVVVASLVFCTIPDVDAALSEVARVLAPGGEFRFLEHVRGEGTVGGVHDALAPVWKRVAGGCHLNRETADVFRTDGRFELADCEWLDFPLSSLVPIVRGTLDRCGDPTGR